MAQIPKGRSVKGPYKPVCRDCAIYFSITLYIQSQPTPLGSTYALCRARKTQRLVEHFLPWKRCDPKWVMGCLLAVEFFLFKLRSTYSTDYPATLIQHDFQNMLQAVDSTGPTPSPAMHSMAWGKNMRFEYMDFMTKGDKGVFILGICWTVCRRACRGLKEKTPFTIFWWITHELSVVCFGTSNLYNSLEFWRFQKVSKTPVSRMSFVVCHWFLTSDESNKLQQPQSTLNPPLTSKILKDLCFRLPCWRPCAPCGRHAAKDLLHVLV